MPNATVMLPFYYDPISPYVWLAIRQLPRLQERGLQIECRPVLFAALLNANGQKGPAEIPSKRAYTFADVLRYAAMLGLPFRGPPSHPFNPLRALRMCTAIEDSVQRLRLASAFSIACWEEGADLTTEADLIRLADEAGLDGAALYARAEQKEVKAQLQTASEQALADGVFGVPSFDLNGEIFWGADRIDSLLWRLDNPQRQDLALADFLQRGASAQRKQATSA